jgi:hypothetical protein
MAAQWWMDEAGGEFGRRTFRRLHFGALLAVALLAPLYAALQPALLRRGWIAQADFAGPAWPVLAAVCGACAALAVFGARLHARGRRFGSLACTALWMVALAAAFAPAYARSPHGRYRQIEDCRRVVSAVGGARLLHLDLPEMPYNDAPNQKLLLYARRTIPRVAPDGLPDAARSPAAVFVMAPAGGRADALLSAAGFTPLFDWHDGSRPRRLWRHAGGGKAGP